MIDLSSESMRVQTWMGENILKFLAEFPKKHPAKFAFLRPPTVGFLFESTSMLKWTTRRRIAQTFTHPEYALLEYPSWPNDYETDSPMIKRHDSKVVRHDHSKRDQVFNRHFFEFLMRVVTIIIRQSKRSIARSGWGLKFWIARALHSVVCFNRKLNPAARVLDKIGLADFNKDDARQTRLRSPAPGPAY